MTKEQAAALRDAIAAVRLTKDALAGVSYEDLEPDMDAILGLETREGIAMRAGILMGMCASKFTNEELDEIALRGLGAEIE